jgi:toxin ParE1/3/4
MARLVYSRQAAIDIDDIMAFSVAEFGNAVAADYLAGLELACELLREFPEMAAVYPRITPEVRCLIYRSHRIFYRADADQLLVVRVLHHARDVEGAMGLG